MKGEKLELVRGSGNVFRDLGRENADVEQLKALLAAEILKALDREKLTVRAAHAKTGFAAADFSRVLKCGPREVHGRSAGIHAEPARLPSRGEIRIRSVKPARGSATVRPLHRETARPQHVQEKLTVLGRTTRTRAYRRGRALPICRPILRHLTGRHSGGLLYRFADRVLLFRIQFAAVGGDVEDVDGFVRFGVDQDHFDVAAVGGDRGRQVVEQAGAVLGHDLDQGGGAAGLGIERHARRDAAPCGWAARASAGCAAVPSRRPCPASTRSTVACRRSTSVGFSSSVRAGSAKVNVSSTSAAPVGERFGFQDVHAEAGERSGHRGEQERAVVRDQRELPAPIPACGHPPPRRACGSSASSARCSSISASEWVRR